MPDNMKTTTCNVCGAKSRDNVCSDCIGDNGSNHAHKRKSKIKNRAHVIAQAWETLSKSK